MGSAECGLGRAGWCGEVWGSVGRCGEEWVGMGAVGWVWWGCGGGEVRTGRGVWWAGNRGGLGRRCDGKCEGWDRIRFDWFGLVWSHLDVG